MAPWLLKTKKAINSLFSSMVVGDGCFMVTGSSVTCWIVWLRCLKGCGWWVFCWLLLSLPFYSDCFGWVKLSCCYGYFFYHRRVIRSFGPSLLRLQRDCKGSQSTILGGVAISRCCMLPWMGWVLLSELNFATIGFSDWVVDWIVYFSLCCCNLSCSQLGL